MSDAAMSDAAERADMERHAPELSVWDETTCAAVGAMMDALEDEMNQMKAEGVS